MKPYRTTVLPIFVGVFLGLCLAAAGGGCGGSADAAGWRTTVTAGAGLTATPTNPFSGAGTLAVDFAGTGTADTAARSDHTHGTASGVALVAHVEPAAVGGGAMTGLAWTTRVLNTEVYDTANIVTLSANQFTLGPGTYLIEGGQVFAGIQGVPNTFLARVQNVTDGVTVVKALNARLHMAYGSSASVNCPVPRTLLTLAATKTFELQYFCESSSADPYALGFSGAPGWNTGPETYAYVAIQKLN